MQPQVRVHPFQQHLYDVSVPVSRVKAAGRGAMCVCVCVCLKAIQNPHGIGSVGPEWLDK